MAGIDDNMAVIGDWVPPSPSLRTFFAEISGDDISSREPPSENGVDGQVTSGNTDLGPFPEQKSRLAARAGFNAPRLNTESIRTSDLSPSTDMRSPYLTIPSGLSPTTLLESPVFLSNSLAQPSPTTGKFPFIPNGNGKSSAFISEASDKSKDNINTSFAFKPVAEPGSFSLGPTNKQSFPSIEASVQSENSHQSQNVDAAKVHSQYRDSLSLQTDFTRAATEKDNGCNSISADQRTEHSPPLVEQQDEGGDQRGSGDSMVAGGASSEDGYNWRKYGQKQVKGSEYPRSYYKCTHPNCPVKKKVERSHEGHITEIIYKGAHNHPKPIPNRRSIIGSNSLLDMQDIPEHAGLQSVADGNPIWANTQKGAVGGTPEWRHDNVEVTSSASVAPKYCNQSSSLRAQNGTPFESGDAVDASSTFSNDEDEDDRATHCSVGYDGEEEESESKRRKIEAYATEMTGASRVIREPRVVVQTTSEVDILEDGYRWRKYGQKVVKGNPNPRSYYKCTSAGCIVRKHVERASHDLKSVITTYEGKHNHDIPAARNGSHVNSSSSSAATAHAAAAAAGGGGQIHVPQPSQLHSSMAAAFGSFRVPGRQQLGHSPGFSFGMHQPGLANLAMAGLGPGQSELPGFPVHPYLAQQQRQLNEMGFMMPKGEPKVEPMLEPGLNLSNRQAIYQQLMSRLPLGP